MARFRRNPTKQLESLEAAIRDYLGWSFVLDSGAELDLTENQRTQARTRKAQADQTATARLLQTYIWALVPTQPNPQLPFTVDDFPDRTRPAQVAFPDRVLRGPEFERTELGRIVVVALAP